MKKSKIKNIFFLKNLNNFLLLKKHKMVEYELKVLNKTQIQPKKTKHKIFVDIGYKKYLQEIRYPKLQELFEKQMNCFWYPHEIDFSKDKYDFDNKLDEESRELIKTVLCFFSFSDGIVIENININFSEEVNLCEAKNFYPFQNAIEVVHSIIYNKSIDILITDSEEKKKLMDKIENDPYINEKKDWMKKYLNNKIHFTKRLFAFSIIEGLFFQGNFCVIYWLKKRGLMPGLCLSNDFIARDECIHSTFSIELLLIALEDLSDSNEDGILNEEEARKIMKEAVLIESKNVKNNIKNKLSGMNSDLMIQFVKYISDNIMKALGFRKIYNSKNPFNWMDMINIPGQTNFFEKRNSNYNRKKTNNHLKNNKTLVFNFKNKDF